MLIKKLPDTLINKIAAGEVVERPSSVVRELVENALDAGATEISVVVEEGGKSLIEVRDNGSGMGVEDALLCIERHATSKIAHEDDLTTIQTLGFRGEALSAIAAVSKLTLTTKRAVDELGRKIIVVGGKLLSNEPCAAPAGTMVSVSNLFFNTPARKKFLKTDRTEEDRIKQWLIASSFANPTVRYSFRIGAKEVLLLSSESSLHERAAKIFFDPAVNISHVTSEYTVVGRVAHPAQARGNAHALFLLVNGRVVSDKTVLRAVRDGFLGMLKDREYPVGVVSLTAQPQLVDVNVHPQKSEVRFSEPQKVFLTVRTAVGRALDGLTHGLRREHGGSPPVYGAHSATQLFELRDSVPQQGRSEPYAHYRASPQALDLSYRADTDGTAALSIESSAISAPVQVPQEIRVVGRLLDTFIVCEQAEKMVLIDFHAAHERINFNRIYADLCARERSAQRLLFPITIEVGHEGFATWLGAGGILREAGFDFEAFGESSLIIREIPSWIESSSVEKLVRELAESLTVTAPLDARLRAIAARLACHASVRGGDILRDHEIAALLKELDNAESSGACPHGRPVIIGIPRQELHRWFGR